MKLKQVIPSLSALVLAAAASVPAQADVILDGWQIGSSQFVAQTHIGHLGLVGGGSAVKQEVDSFGNVYQFAKFQELGLIFSSQVITENTPGGGDTGFPQNFPLNTGIRISFTNVFGYVSDLLPGGGFKYVFQGGNFAMESTNNGGSSFVPMTSGKIIGIGGVANATNVIGGVAGSSNVLASSATLLGGTVDAGFILNDSLGVSLIPELLGGGVLFQATTTNTIAGGPSVLGACGFSTYVGGAQCASFNITSEGALNITRVPEPGSLALVGLALALIGGIGSVGRRAPKAA